MVVPLSPIQVLCFADSLSVICLTICFCLYFYIGKDFAVNNLSYGFVVPSFRPILELPPQLQFMKEPGQSIIWLMRELF